MRIIFSGLIGLVMMACVFACPAQVKSHFAGFTEPAAGLASEAADSVAALIDALTGLTPDIGPDEPAI